MIPILKPNFKTVKFHREIYVNQKIIIDQAYPSPTGSACEKNWVFLNPDELIYSWSPLTVYSREGLEKKREFRTPPIFRFFRGSTSTVDHGDFKMCLVHSVHYENPRIYLHHLVLMQKDGKPVMHSFPFSFEGEKIEYCLSINIYGDEIEFNYSTWDSNSKSMRVPLIYFADKMIYLK
jgi:hypothetical protein